MNKDENRRKTNLVWFWFRTILHANLRSRQKQKENNKNSQTVFATGVVFFCIYASDLPNPVTVCNSTSGLLQKHHIFPLSSIIRLFTGFFLSTVCTVHCKHNKMKLSLWKDSYHENSEINISLEACADLRGTESHMERVLLDTDTFLINDHEK